MSRWVCQEKVILLEKVMLVLVAVKAGAVKGGSRFFAIEASSQFVLSGVCHQDACYQGVDHQGGYSFLEVGKRHQPCFES